MTRSLERKIIGYYYLVTQLSGVIKLTITGYNTGMGNFELKYSKTFKSTIYISIVFCHNSCICLNKIYKKI